MTDFTSELINSVTHVPVGIEHPVAIAGLVGVAVTAHFAAKAVHDRTTEQYSVDFPNPALLEASISPDDRQNTRARLAVISLFLAGGSLLGAQLIGRPHAEVERANPQANLVIIEDVSNSMVLSTDMDVAGTTRTVAVQRAVAGADFSGNLAVIQVADGARVVLPLTHDWHRQLPSLDKPQVNPNGGSLQPALELAASLLPIDATSKLRQGSVLLISDGTVADSAKALADEATHLAQQGVELKVVVPGTANGSYRLPNTTAQVSSAAQPERFKGLADASVVTVNTALETTRALRDTVHTSGQSREQQPNVLLGAFGALVLAGALSRDVAQRLMRKV